MEANVYRFLRTRDVKVEYEPVIFKFPKDASYLGITGYIPDFRVSFGRHVHFIEVKGRWDPPALEKARLMKKYHPEVKMQYINVREYKIIEKCYGWRIPHWE